MKEQTFRMAMEKLNSTSQDDVLDALNFLCKLISKG